MELGNIMFGNSRGKYSIDREWVKHFRKLLNFFNIDDYGFYEKHDSEFLTADGGFENETFLIKPYYWGEDEEEMKKPNFVYKPTGFTIDWYKYPFRDSYSNENITEKEFIDIINDCIQSCKE